MSSLGEVQRIIGLSLNKIQMGRNQRGGLPLHKNLLVATVLNKARDVYMQETMYMNYRLMACGQFAGATHHSSDMEDEDTPEVEDYEEDSESDVEDEIDPTSTIPAAVTKKEYISQALSSCAAAPTANQVSVAGSTAAANSSCELNQQQQLSQSHNQQQSTSFLSALSASCGVVAAAVHHQQQQLQMQQQEKAAAAEQLQACSAANNSNNNISDEGFIDESDCDCDRRNFCQDSSENSRVPFQYCYTCAPFHPSNGRGPTLVSPGQSLTSGCVIPPQPTNPIVSAVKHLTADQPEDKLIYDLDSKSTKNSSPGMVNKRKRHISSEETQEAISTILPKKLKVSEEEDTEVDEKEDKDDLNDSGFQEENKYFHPAFRSPHPHHSPNGMEVEQITSLVSIFSFGQQLFNSGCIDRSLTAYSTASTPSSPTPETVDSPAGNEKLGVATGTTGEDEESGDESDSDTSSDSGHSSDDQNNVDDLNTTNIDTAVTNHNSDELPLVAPVLVASSNNNIANLVATTKNSCVADIAAESGKSGSNALVADDASNVVPCASLSSGAVVVPTAAMATVV